MRGVHARFLLALPICLLLLAPDLAPAQVARQDTRGALDGLHRWLADSEHEAGWRAYLRSDELEAELAKGTGANVPRLREILELYSANAPGLSNENFADVRVALEAWIDELTLPKVDALRELSKEAADAVEPVDQQRLAAAKERLQRATRNLNLFLQRGGTAKERGWKGFLRFEDLQAELEAESPRLVDLTQIWAIYAGEQSGLNHPRFAAVRDALGEYVQLAEFLNDEKTGLAWLPENLDAYLENPSEQTAAELGLVLGWLQRTGQQGDLVEAVRYHYAKPNLLLDASERLIVFGFAETVDQTDDVNDYRNGNRVTGTSRTEAEITAALVPNHKRGQVDVHMDGTIRSATQSYNPNGVYVDTTGVTQVDAVKAVYFTGDGLREAPAQARCQTENTVTDIRANSPNIESIARQRVRDNHAANERQAARRAERRVENDLTRRVRESLADANQQMQDNFLLPIERRGVDPRLIRFRSTEGTLSSTMILAAPEHLASASDAPQFKASGDVVAQVHASWLNNYGDIVMRGAVMSDVSLAEAVEEWRGEVPEELQVTPDSDPWDITFASRRPVRLEVGDDTLTITLRGDRFTARRRAMNERMHVSAKYQVKRGGGKVKLIRDGDVSITFPDQGERLSVRYITLRTFWQTKFGAMFEPEYEDLSLRLRGAWEKAGPLKLTTLATQPGGWLGLAWEMPKDAGRASGAE